MNPRSYMISKRNAFGLTREAMAKKLGMGISPKLLEMLETDDQCVTHPTFVDRIAKVYRLTKEQKTMMLPENHRPGPNYDPDRYKFEADKWIS